MSANISTSNIIKAPIVTEKAHAIGEANKCIALVVSKTASKLQIANTVEKLFQVKVEKVNTVKIKGKVKSFAGRRGVRSDVKKAYITLKEGFDINFVNQ
jgi:large subunit ribosomal protein L23